MIRRALRLVPRLVIFWLLLSGHYTGLLLALGALSVLVVLWILQRMAVVDGAEGRQRLSVRAPLYAMWLAWQVLTSSFDVLRRVWSPRPAPQPVTETVPVGGLSEFAIVAYANSITLTPGTLSLEVDETGIEVHSLTEDGLDDLRTGRMLAGVRRLEAR